MEFRKLVILAMAIFLVMEMPKGIRAQSRCDTACANDASCSAGICSLSRCSDTGGCYELCFKCAGIETCSSVGLTCKPSGSINFGWNSSTNLKYSFPFIFVLFLSWIFV